MMVRLSGNCCPFCGVATDVPHESQQGCIDALRAEIARMREILEQVKEPPVSRRSDQDAEVA